MSRGHINEKLHTSFANTGRAAGVGISFDRYDDESGYRPTPRARGAVRLPSDDLTPAEREALNSPVRVYKEERCKETTNE